MLKMLFLIAVVFLSFGTACAGTNSTLTLVYKDIGNPPFMEIAPDCSGLYKDLMTRAAEKIGFKLNIIRGPKKRGYNMLEDGKADLYASAAFRLNRSKFLAYFSNGLYRHNQYFGLTTLKIPYINNIKDINKFGLVWVVELGSSKPERAKRYGVKYSTIKKVSVERAVQLLKRNRPFFFLINKEDVYIYMRENKLTSMADIGVLLHDFFPDVIAPLYTNFSRNSPFYREQLNNKYDKSKPLCPDNLPYEPTPESVPYRLRQALQEMIDSGEVKDLAKKYFGDKWRYIIEEKGRSGVNGIGAEKLEHCPK